MTFVSVLQLISAAAGLVSAIFWWRSAQNPAMTVTELPDLEDGAFAMTVGDRHIVYDVPGQSRLNARGALFAAASILIQAVAMGFTALGL